MGFKIISLEVLDGCEPDHSKNLKYNSPYLFLKNYKIEKKDGKDVINLLSEDLDLYSFNSKIKINISAIVGKNGSGKSSIIDLIIKTINNFFHDYKVKHPERDYHSVELVNGIEISLIYKTGEGVFKLYVCSNKAKKEPKYKIFKYSFDSSTNQYRDPEDITHSFFLDHFFYTEVINYSLYAYNSKLEGEWISKIFHKNDAYQTPVVLNPFRKKGNININLENVLIHQRLLANLLKITSENKVNLNLGENLKASDLIISLTDSDYYKKKATEDFKVQLDDFSDEYKEKLLNLVIRVFSETNLIKVTDPKILELSKVYILYKFISICDKYTEYKKGNYFNFEKAEFTNLSDLIQRLKKDNSHITFKLRQLINYLVHQHIPFDTNIEVNKLSLEKIAVEINSRTKTKNLINLLPPPIFRSDIQLQSKKSNRKNIKFSLLSSGEKQQIYSINSIFYHLINLDSVHESTDKRKTAYQNINIILEEIELYFHPEFQRTYIYRLLKGIELLNLKNIREINIIFVTHSPFVLSDIPSQNILYLAIDEDGKSISLTENKKSFSANIHHLLQDNFFFDQKIYIGEFANSKISEFIKFLNNSKQEAKVDYYHHIIKLIDEPILRNKLHEMLKEKHPALYEKNTRKESERLVKAYAEKLGVDVNFKKTK